MKNFNTTKLIIGGVLVIGGIIAIRKSHQNEYKTGEGLGAITMAAGVVMLFLSAK